MSSNNSESNSRWNMPSLKNVGQVVAGVVITGVVVSSLKYTWNYYQNTNLVNDKKTTVVQLDENKTEVDEL